MSDVKGTARVVALGLLVASGCSSDPTATVAPATGNLPAADLHLVGFDGWPLAFDVVNDGFEALDCRVTLHRAGGALRTLQAPVELESGRCAVSWDGRDAAGAVARTGVIEVTVAVDPPRDGEPAEGHEPAATATMQIEVVRVGIASIDLVGDGRVALMYGAMDQVERGYYSIPDDRPLWRMGPSADEDAAAVRLEHADGTPRALPEPWDDLRSPPLDPDTDDGVAQDTYNLPVGFLAGAPIEVRAELNADVAGSPGGGAATTVELRLVAPGGGLLTGEDAFVHGRTVAVALDPSPVTAVGRYDLVLDWRFEMRAPPGEWMAMPGSIATVHRVYGMAGQPRFEHASEPHAPWVEVVDQVAGWVDAQTADPIEVAGAVVEGVYYDLDLVYDRESGASTYTYYPGWGYDGAQFDLSAFLARGDGNVINCSDAGSIVSTFVNMIGIDFRYHILRRADGQGFDLNYIKAIGWDEFDETPFFNGRGAFRYHAVVGPEDGSFYDATLALDGDGDPLAAPHEELLAAGLVPDDYLWALSSQWEQVNVYQDEQVEIQ